MMRKVELEEIYKKYPFVYEVNEELMIIGSGVFKQCTQDIIQTYYNRYKEKIREIGRDKILTHKLDDVEIDTLIYLFRKLMSYADVSSDTYDGNAKGNLLKYLSGLSQEGKEELLLQLEDYIYCFGYYHEKF